MSDEKEVAGSKFFDSFTDFVEPLSKSKNNVDSKLKNVQNYYSNDERNNRNYVNKKSLNGNKISKNMLHLKNYQSYKNFTDQAESKSNFNLHTSECSNKPNEEKGTKFLKKHRRSTSYTREGEEAEFFDNNRKNNLLNFSSNNINPKFSIEVGEIGSELPAQNYNHNLHISAATSPNRRVELRDLLKDRNSPLNSDSLSKSSFEEVMEIRRNEQKNCKFAEMEVDEEAKKNTLDNFFDFNNNQFGTSLLKTKIVNPNPITIELNYNNRANKLGRIFNSKESNKGKDCQNDKLLSHTSRNNKLKDACIQFLESKQYEIENCEEREQKFEKIIEIEKTISELQDEDKYVRKFEPIIAEMREEQFIQIADNDQTNIENQILLNCNNYMDKIKVCEDDVTNLSDYGIIAFPDSSATYSSSSVTNNTNNKNNNLIEREPGEINEEHEITIIDINAMNIDDENHFPNFYKSLSEPSIDEKKNNPNSIILYPPFFEQIIDTNDLEIDSRLKEIEVMMDQIELNEEQKSYMKMSAEVRIPKVKNKKESYFNNSFLIFYLNTFPLSSLHRKIKMRDFKLNIILDLDSTLLFADVEKNVAESLKDNSHLIQPIINETPYTLRLRLRKYTVEFIQRVSKISNIYVSTHGQEPYAREVVKILNKESGVEILQENVSAAKGQITYKSLKTFTEDKNFKSNSLIIDDNAKAWEVEYWGNMIQSMKFLSFIPSINFFDKNEKIMKQNETSGKYSFNYTYLLSHNRMQDCNDIVHDFKDEFNCPFSLEYDYSNKFQLHYITELVENVYKLCVLQNISAEEALRNLKQNVLIGLNINVDYLNLGIEGKKVIKEIIKLLGGKYESSEKYCSHYIISNTKINEFLSHKSNNQNFRTSKIYCLNLKWLFHCFFFLKKLDENDVEYKMII